MDARSAAQGYLQRTDQQFHWRNEGYAHLRRLPRRARLAQAQGRAQGAQRGAERRPRRSSASAARDITEAHWDAFFDFYTDTGSRKWGRPYLNRRFFSLLGAGHGRPLPAGAWPSAAAAISPARSTSSAAIASTAATGARSSITRCLHFELCYYQAIDYAIEHGPRARRGRRAGRAQAGARLHADDDLLGALDRRSRLAARYCALPAGRARARSPRTLPPLAEFGPYRKGDVVSGVARYA